MRELMISICLNILNIFANCTGNRLLNILSHRKLGYKKRCSRRFLHGQKDRKVKPHKKRASGQQGMATLEATSLLLLASVSAGAAISHHNAQIALTEQSMLNMTAASLQSAVQLQQAKTLINRGVVSGVVKGLAAGLNANTSTSSLQCKALWQQLLVSQSPITTTHDHDLAEQGYWHVSANASRCEYRYYSPKYQDTAIAEGSSEYPTSLNNSVKTPGAIILDIRSGDVYVQKERRNKA